MLKIIPVVHAIQEIKVLQKVNQIHALERAYSFTI